MKKTFFLSLLLLGLLVSCGGPQSSEEPLPSQTESTEVSSEDDLPPPPPGTSVGEAELGDVTIDGEIPGGWLYITNNEDYPNPEFYADGGLKLNFSNQAIKSPAYDNVVNSITITGKLNKNTRKEGANTTLTLYKLDGNNEVEVDSVEFAEADLSTYTETLEISGGTTQFVIKLTGNVGYNVNLKTIELN